jgi:hypothetical protein
MGKAGFEPAMTKVSRFTVCRLEPLSHFPFIHTPCAKQKILGITQSVFLFEEMKATHTCVKKYVFVKRCFLCCACAPV